MIFIHRPATPDVYFPHFSRIYNDEFIYFILNNFFFFFQERIEYQPSLDLFFGVLHLGYRLPAEIINKK